MAAPRAAAVGMGPSAPRLVRTFQGRVAVVTGGASGIGLGMAEAFAAAGMYVVLADVDAAHLATAVERVRTNGAPDVLAVPTDVGDHSSVADLARRSVDAFGAVHVLCNNAGISAIGRQWQTPLDDWNAVLAVNLLGVVHGIHAFMPVLLEQEEAHVVNTASMSGLIASPGMGAYVATKHAVVGLTKALRADLAGRWPHVGVTLVCPGAVATNLADRVRTLGRPGDAAHVDALREQLAGAMPPREVGDAIVKAVRDRVFWVLPNGATHLAMLDAEIAELHADADPAGRPRG
jgi:NAD(P)-dependent dehydrogenase (short-subunit alcohol dehydrogenase family)